MYYEIATMTLPSAGCAGSKSKYKPSPRPVGGGELLGCWFTDIGPLNQMLVYQRIP